MKQIKILWQKFHKTKNKKAKKEKAKNRKNGEKLLTNVNNDY
jgi:hypothetical protein